MIVLRRETSRYKIYTIDDRRILDLDATEEFAVQLAIILEDNAQEGWKLCTITQYHGEYVIVLAT